MDYPISYANICDRASSIINSGFATASQTDATFVDKTIAAVIGFCSSAIPAMIIARHLNKNCNRLILINGAYFPEDNNLDRTQYERDVGKMISHLNTDGFRAFFDLVHSLYSMKVGIDKESTPVTKAFSSFESFDRYLNSIKFLSMCNTEEIAANIEAYTHILIGGNDQIVNPSAAMRLSENFINSQKFIDPIGNHYDWLGDGIMRSEIERILRN
ncbi:coronamic acid synthetase (plasmid) [Azospirillum sp. B510]|nr:coronamic acid synthetase [Azospirillum sp. B510]